MATTVPRGQPSAEPSIALTLPFTPRSASVAREHLEEFLHALGLSEDFVDDSRLVISELVGNAVRHARPLGDGTMRIGFEWLGEGADGAAVDLFVTDGGSVTVPHHVVNESADAFGRGLTLVEALAARWWYESDEQPEPYGTVHAVIAPGQVARTA
ncbi:hypothetical protein GCM10011519_22360 [Marmoricola endophyticus]|uniref:Histidine kinase/HSP90-like ATPase domain-containing protein n=1 Tax=Marmoricola endophyticus TaxID=2040280 RepID=A0A917F694_9ACTN|nr:ATP-binding protein [Marmoricola endophyticus]GGF47856.1 hypothetical protein GCM10011519_22360 [Marmoricola endophyticus]